MTLIIKSKDWKYLKPKLPPKLIVYKSDLPSQSYDQEPKTIKEHTGKVIGVCVCLLSGKILSLAKGVHASVCEYYNVNPKDVKKTGWKLDNGNFVWR